MQLEANTFCKKQSHYKTARWHTRDRVIKGCTDIPPKIQKAKVAAEAAMTP